MSEDLIKLHVDGESFWAQDLGQGRARVANILLSDLCTLDDVVEFDPQTRHVVSVVEPHPQTRWIVEYHPPTREGYTALREAFSAARLEGARPGLALMLVPDEVEIADLLLALALRSDVQAQLFAWGAWGKE